MMPAYLIGVMSIVMCLLGLDGGEGVGGETLGAEQHLGGGGRAEFGQADQGDEQVALDFGDDRRTGLVIGGRVAHDGPLG